MMMPVRALGKSGWAMRQGVTFICRKAALPIEASLKMPCTPVFVRPKLA